MEALREMARAGSPLICYGGCGSDKILVATDFQRIAAEEFLRQPVAKPGARAAAEPYQRGVLGLVSYSDGARDGGASSRFVRVNHARWMPREAWSIPSHAVESLRLQPLSSEEAYLATARAVQEDIRNGRYYQLNLLRYFAVEPVPAEQLWDRWCRWSGPFGVWWRDADFRLVSFSPERFVHLYEEHDAWIAETEPIKGTGASTVDEDDAKERAELNMIVDLMRNDLHRICVPHSVRVIDPGSVHHFPGIAHRVAKIRGQVRSEITMRDVLAALCPGGSITGAPKKEVMRAIREYEGRPRDFFMGHAFYWDEATGMFDSSILIRTLLCPPQGPWMYAAGSGLTLRSDPEKEAAEIHLKCGVLNSP